MQVGFRGRNGQDHQPSVYPQQALGELRPVVDNLSTESREELAV
jgi:hypothetical protein